MKIIASTIVALTILTGSVATAFAAPYSGSTFERLDQDQRGGHGG